MMDKNYSIDSMENIGLNSVQIRFEAIILSQINTLRIELNHTNYDADRYTLLSQIILKYIILGDKNYNFLGNKLVESFISKREAYIVADSLITQKLMLAINSKNENWIAETYNQQGFISNCLNNTHKAIEAYSSALNLFLEAENYKMIKNSLDEISYSYRTLGDIISPISNNFSILKDLSKEISKSNRVRFDYASPKLIGDSSIIQILNNRISEDIKYANDITNDDRIEKAELDKVRQIEHLKYIETVSNLTRQQLINRNRELEIKTLNQNDSIQQLLIKQRDDKLKEAKLIAANAKLGLKQKEENLNDQQKLNTIIISTGAVFLCFLISLFFFYKRKRDAEHKQKETSLSLQVSETEMKALRSQMNPHFIFNALQSIQTFLMSNKSEEANKYLLKFSKLMRLVLENSQHSEVLLKLDLQALELYMQLESIRLPHPFTYQFHIDENVDGETTTIPPLILQPFVENAIWHGLQYKTEPGHINIYISKKDNALFATVEDNGVGRDLSKQVQQPMLLKKESLGMKLTEERLKILNEIKNIKSQFEITDLFTKDNQPAGTKVELSLPLVS